ncbi:RsfA family transcriptional regulator [Lederbergia lenta]|uniref:RsfA family transcription factor n=1 Tax=Lederbergia lenta TaxID=1467 RepID=A0A2X4WGD9_LEDLE|nr:RsfA family transcriptional regulator [Lederbergia lenta]MCM3112099.1 RsfA family transcriptional regulator [Lederbergia lenta]MEC2323269.1 RsfA family transcriptional regulator [Lederbergia lenta]SQI63106.1 RsfA family transcription factor [Lederbergia lenta]
MKTRQDAWTEENDLLLAETVLRHVREGSTQLNAFEEVGDKLNRTSAACGFRWNAVVRHQYEKALDLAKKQRKQRQRMLGKDQGGKKKLLYQPPQPFINESQSAILSAMEETENVPTDTIDQNNFYQEELGQEESMAESLPFNNYLLPAPASTSAVGEMNMDKIIAYLQQFQNSEFHLDILRNENARLKREKADLQGENKTLQDKVAKLEDNSVTMQEDYETLMKILNRARKLVLFEEDDRQSNSFKMDRNGNLEKLAE